MNNKQIGKGRINDDMQKDEKANEERRNTISIAYILLKLPPNGSAGSTDGYLCRDKLTHSNTLPQLSSDLFLTRILNSCKTRNVERSCAGE